MMKLNMRKSFFLGSVWNLKSSKEIKKMFKLNILILYVYVNFFFIII